MPGATVRLRMGRVRVRAMEKRKDVGRRADDFSTTTCYHYPHSAVGSGDFSVGPSIVLVLVCNWGNDCDAKYTPLRGSSRPWTTISQDRISPAPIAPRWVSKERQYDAVEIS